MDVLELRRDDLLPALHETFAVVEAEMLAALDDAATLAEEEAFAATERFLRLAIEVWGNSVTVVASSAAGARVHRLRAMFGEHCGYQGGFA